LGDQADKLKKGLESNELSLHRYKIDKNILSVDLDAQSNMLREEMRQLNDALTTVRTKREEVAAKRNALATVPVDNPGELPANELLHSVLLQSLRQRYEDAQRDREALLGAGRGANHPTVTAAQARVEGSRKALIAEVKNIQAAADRELTAVSAHAGGIAGLYARAKAQAFELNLLEIEYNKLRRERDNTAKLYQLVLERSKESDLARLLQVNNVRIIDRPQRPVDAIYPRTLMNIAGGILLGLLLGIGAAIMRALFDRTLKTPDDVEHELGVAFLGLIPEIDEAKKATRTGSRKGRRKKSQQGTSRELIVHALSRSRIAEAARAVRTNLMFMSPDRPYKTILITSAGPAEGKTTVACCVAIAMAQAGQRVLLIDCDLRRPRIHRVFGKQSDTGVTTLLVGDGELCEDELKTDIPNLSVLSAGPIPPTPSELFLSNRFKALLESATEKYDRVIIDSPPVAVVTDAAILSTLVDGTVMVVRAFATTKDVARHGARALADVGGNTVGVVLNAVDVSRQGYQYYHYVYYAYDRRGYYEGYGEPPNSSRSSSSSEGAGLAH
jgi:capsular exopolysaccharide synthesis family protein